MLSAQTESVAEPSEETIEKIVEEREQNGKFEDFGDFIRRMAGGDVNKRAIENFIKAGAFDSLDGNRRAYMQYYDNILQQYLMLYIKQQLS